MTAMSTLLDSSLKQVDLSKEFRAIISTVTLMLNTYVNFLAEEGNCNQTPTVVSETNTRPGYFDDSYQFIEFPASAVLTDGIKGERGSPSPNYWRGEEYKEAGFVLDLGCKSFLREIRVRRPSREE